MRGDIQMDKKIKPKQLDEQEYEKCVICKCKTTIKKEEPIESRDGYIEGVGQLCYKCYRDFK